MVAETERAEARALPLIAVCGRPNVGKITLFNRLTGSRRSIVGDEPGITRDRIYGEIEWMGRDVRIVDTGGVMPDDEALIPSEIFRQAQVALEEADAIVMVVDGRTELASPDMELARLLLRGGKPVFLAVNKMDTGRCWRGRRTSGGWGSGMCCRSRRSMGRASAICWMRCLRCCRGGGGGAGEVMLTAEDEAEEDEGWTGLLRSILRRSGAAAAVAW